MPDMIAIDRKLYTVIETVKRDRKKNIEVVILSYNGSKRRAVRKNGKPFQWVDGPGLNLFAK